MEGVNCITKSLLINKYHQSDKTEDNKVGKAYGMHEEGKNTHRRLGTYKRRFKDNIKLGVKRYRNKRRVSRT